MYICIYILRVYVVIMTGLYEFLSARNIALPKPDETYQRETANAMPP